MPHGVSVNRLHGFGRFILQNTSRGGGARRRSSADHLSCLEEERRGDGEAESLSDLEIDDQLERHGLLHGQVPRLGSLEDSVYVVGGTPVQVRETRSIGHQTASHDPFP